MSRDANLNKVFTTLGASSHALEERQNEDYYATDPIAIDYLLSVEKFNINISEIAVGSGHLANRLIEHGYNVVGYDIIDRGFKNTIISDFLKIKEININCDIITNPPYSLAKEFIEHSMELVNNGTKIAMFLKLTFLESAKRLTMFKKYPPKTIYIFSKRISCAKNGDFNNYESSAIAYAWFVWEKGFTGDPIVKWL